MLSKIRSMAVMGIEAIEIDIEADISEMLPSFTIVGLPDGAVREARERVMSAIKNCGFEFPSRKVTINMAPADIRKEGSGFDLPIAIGLLEASSQVTLNNAGNYLIAGELSLDGSVKRIKGMLSMAICARDRGITGMIVPVDNAMEAAVAEGVSVHPVATLAEALEFLQGKRVIEPYKTDLGSLFNKARQYPIDFRDVKGQEHIKRALLVAAAGGHNIMMIGPPGSGKTMLARRLPTILPDLTLDEALETTKIHSVAGLLDAATPLLATRPFRSPHHTISDAGLVGGGSYPRPGEVSLSHHGVLFLDELPEFNKNVLENLRQPLEDGKVTISRALMSLSYPARFMLAVALNPCPCGYFTDPRHECACTPQQIQKYMSKISGPLLDRIDIHVEVPALSYDELAQKTAGPDSSVMRAQVAAARAAQHGRFKGEKKIFCNAHMESKHLKVHCELDDASMALLKTAIDKMGLSARAFDRIHKVARTIADLDGKEKILQAHVAEAIHYRSLDRKLWMGDEPVKVQYHIGLSLSIAFAVYAVYRSIAMAVASFFAGVFLDADHVFDFLREYGFRCDRRFFFHVFHNTLFRKLVLPLHAWEWLVLLAALPVFSLGSYVSIGVFIGIGQHLIADQLTNRIHRWGYFISYRVWKKFITSKIFPGRGLL